MKKKLKKIFATLTLLACIVTAGKGCSKPIENHSENTNTGKDKDNTSFSTQNSQNVICIEDKLMPGPEFSVNIGRETFLSGKITLSETYGVPYKIDIKVLGEENNNISIECSYVLENGQLVPVPRPSQIENLDWEMGFSDPYYEMEVYIDYLMGIALKRPFDEEMFYNIDWVITPSSETFNWVTNDDDTVTGQYDFKIMSSNYTYTVKYSDKTRTTLISSHIEDKEGKIVSTGSSMPLHARMNRVRWVKPNDSKDALLSSYMSTVNFFEEITCMDEVNLTERMVREERICDFRAKENPIAQIEYYEEIYKTESIQGKQMPITRPSKTIISSPHLDEPITINYTYSTQGDSYYINSRENQIKTDEKGAIQWVDIGAEIKYYIDWIKLEDAHKRNWKPGTIDYYTQTKRLKYSPTGKLERETFFVMDTLVLYTDYSYTDGRKVVSQMYYKDGEPVLLEEYSPEGTLTSTYEYLKAANGCSYVDHFMTTTGVHHISINNSAGNTTLDITSSSNSTLTKSDVGNYLVIYFEYPDGTGDIYEIDSEGTLAYRTMISKINAGQGTRVYRYIGDKLLFSQDYNSAEFNIQEFLPWSDSYDDSWKKLAKDNEGLFYTENITPDSYLQTSTRAYPDGEVTTLELPNETFSDGVQHILTLTKRS